MALGNLTLSFKERNDNKALILTDTTNVVLTATSWDAGTNISWTDLDGSTYDILLDITITDSSGTATTYTQIDLYDEFGPFTLYDDLVFTIDPTMLIESGAATTAFTSDDVMPDGIYDITYTVTNAGTAGADVEKEYKLLVNNVSKANAYEMIRQLPNIYEFQGDVDSFEVREAMLAMSYIDGMEVTDEDKALVELGVLENIIRNGSNHPW